MQSYKHPPEGQRVFLRKSATAAALLILGLTGCSPQDRPADERYSDHTFVARVGDVRLQKLLLAQGKRNDDSVSVTLPAILYDPPIEIADVRNATANYSEPVEFLMSYFKALIGGSKEEIVAFWCPGSRTKVKEMLNDPDLAQRSREGMARNPSLVVVGQVKNSGFVSVLQKRSVTWAGSPVWAVTMASEQGGSCLVQDPPDDLDMAIVEASFANEYAQQR